MEAERIDGPTPGGGAYALAHYRDGKGRPCPKAGAAAVELVEFDAAGSQVRRSYGEIRRATPD